MGSNPKMAYQHWHTLAVLYAARQALTNSSGQA
jgi:hypothetical protein